MPDAADACSGQILYARFKALISNSKFVGSSKAIEYEMCTKCKDYVKKALCLGPIPKKRITTHGSRSTQLMRSVGYMKSRVVPCRSVPVNEVQPGIPGQHDFPSCGAIIVMFDGCKRDRSKKIILNSKAHAGVLIWHNGTSYIMHQLGQEMTLSDAHSLLSWKNYFIYPVDTRMVFSNLKRNSEKKSFVDESLKVKQNCLEVAIRIAYTGKERSEDFATFRGNIWFNFSKLFSDMARIGSLECVRLGNVDRPDVDAKLNKSKPKLVRCCLCGRMKCMTEHRIICGSESEELRDGPFFVPLKNVVLVRKNRKGEQIEGDFSQTLFDIENRGRIPSAKSFTGELTIDGISASRGIRKVVPGNDLSIGGRVAALIEGNRIPRDLTELGYGCRLYSEGMWDRVATPDQLKSLNRDFASVASGFDFSKHGIRIEKALNDPAIRIIDLSMEEKKMRNMAKYILHNSSRDDKDLRQECIAQGFILESYSLTKMKHFRFDLSAFVACYLMKGKVGLALWAAFGAFMLGRALPHKWLNALIHGNWKLSEIFFKEIENVIQKYKIHFPLAAKKESGFTWRDFASLNPFFPHLSSCLGWLIPTVIMHCLNPMHESSIMRLYSGDYRKLKTRFSQLLRISGGFVRIHSNLGSDELELVRANLPMNDPTDISWVKARVRVVKTDNKFDLQSICRGGHIRGKTRLLIASNVKN